MKSCLVGEVLVWSESSRRGILKYVQDQDFTLSHSFPKLSELTDGCLWNNYAPFLLLNQLQDEEIDGRKVTWSLADRFNDDMHRGFPASVWKRISRITTEYLTTTGKCS